MSRYRRIIAIGSFVASLTPLTAVAAMPVGSGQPNPVTVNTGSTASSDALIQVRGRHTSSHRPVWIPGSGHRRAVSDRRTEGRAGLHPRIVDTDRPGAGTRSAPVARFAVCYSSSPIDRGLNQTPGSGSYL